MNPHAQTCLDLITNPIFVTPAASWLIAQVSKIMIISIKNHGFSKEVLAAGGGMPSSHTATVIGLLVSSFLKFGAGGFETPMAFFFALVVIYDAMNVRYETGQQGIILNHFMKQHPEDALYREQDPFQESIGHTLPEIIVGMIIGVVVGIIVHLILP